MSTGIYKWYCNKTCICGTPLGRMETSYIDRSWNRYNTVEKTNALKLAKNIYSNYDRGASIKNIAEALKIEIEEVEKYINKRQQLINTIKSEREKSILKS